MVDPPRRHQNARGQGARLRQEILDAAIAVVDETGEPLTLRGVARRGGISAPSIYGHFADLAALTDALLERSFEELRATVAYRSGREHDPVAKLLAAGHAYVAFAWGLRPRYRLMFNAGGYARNAVQTYVIVERLIGQCADAGLSDSVDPHLDAWMLWTGLHGVATLEKPTRPEMLRLGTLDRPALLTEIIRRLARLRP